jgi:hypothetical protein
MGVGPHGQQPEVGAAGVPRVHLVGTGDQVVQRAPVLPEQAEEQPKAEENEAEREHERA